MEVCLANLSTILNGCEEVNFVLSWVKSHFMVKEGIMVGYKAFKKGIELDKVKVEPISNFPVPSSIKQARSFLSHTGF